MDCSGIKSWLAGSGGRLYWRTLGEFADTPEFREYLHREFPEQASEWNDPKGRRQFLKLMSASLALAGVSACTKQPPEQIVPYVRQPEELVPGRPLFFATAYPFGGVATPVLIESHEGHPTKVEGNPQHPASAGGTDIFAQAAILGLYDPDRLQTVMFRGEVRGWADFVTAIKGHLNAQKVTRGAGLRFLTETITSPSIAEQIDVIQRAYPQSKWHRWDAVNRDGARAGARQAAGHPADPIYDVDKADVIVTLDADFLVSGPAAIRYSRDFSTRRRAGVDGESPSLGAGPAAMNRLYAIESTPTLTGAKADHRLPLRASEIDASARALSGQTVASFSNPAAQTFLAAVAKDLQAHRGRSIVIAGDYQPASVHALAHALNESLGNIGTTVTYAPAVDINPVVDQAASLKELVQAMDADQVDVLVIFGGNPVFTAPSDLRFADSLAKVPLAISHGLYADETSRRCHWNLPEAHPFESWSDARAYDGTVTVIQPLIAPLYEGRTLQEVLACFIDAQTGTSAHDLVKDFWTRAYAGVIGGLTITDSAGARFKSADAMWKHVLHDGFVPGTAATGQSPALGVGPSALGVSSQSPTPNAQSPGLEIIFRPDPTVWDGRFANIGWLQELAKPLTKTTWDPSAWMSKPTADAKGLRDGDLVELRYRGNTAKLPVVVMPGHPDNSVTVFFGYGKQVTGRVSAPPEDTAKEFDVFRLRTSDALWFGSGLEIAKAGRYPLSRTQEHHLMENRAPVRVADIETYRKDPDVIARQGEAPPKTLTLIPEWDYTQHYRWGIDRPHVLHRLRHVHPRVPVGEQHPGRRQGAGRPRPGDAVDPRRSLLRRHARRRQLDRHVPPARTVHAVRERAVRARLPGRRHDAQRGRPERHGLQPLRRHAVLLQQLSVQGAPLQLPAVPGLDDAEFRAAAQP
jgi:molybdopterin-containing oxidoreductase family iron-sulfur binding subunit